MARNSAMWGKKPLVRGAVASKRKREQSSGVKIGTAIKITRKNGKTKTTVRGGSSSQMRKNEREQRGKRF